MTDLERKGRSLVEWSETGVDEPHRPSRIRWFVAAFLVSCALWIAGSVAACFIGRFFA